MSHRSKSNTWNPTLPGTFLKPTECGCQWKHSLGTADAPKRSKRLYFSGARAAETPSSRSAVRIGFVANEVRAVDEGGPALAPLV